MFPLFLQSMKGIKGKEYKKYRAGKEERGGKSEGTPTPIFHCPMHVCIPNQYWYYE